MDSVPDALVPQMCRQKGQAARSLKLTDAFFSSLIFFPYNLNRLNIFFITH
jgi:hypothetical protein